MPSKRGTPSTTRNSKSPMKDATLDDVTKSLDKTSMASDTNFSCTSRFSWRSSKARDGVKDIVFLEFQSINLPTS
jgi:hypothetical protein